MEREKTCCFTGHRPDKLPWKYDESNPGCLDLKRRITQSLERAYEEGYRHFITGMALGCDLYFCEAVLALRSRRQKVTLEAAIPCEEQASRWRERDRSRYFALVEQCDYETLVQRRYTSGCMQRRDRYMVDQSQLLIAAYDGMTLGGTMYTLTYALRQGIRADVLEIKREDWFDFQSAEKRESFSL